MPHSPLFSRHKPYKPMNYDKKRECQLPFFGWHSRFFDSLAPLATLSDNIDLDSMFGEKSPKTSDLIDKPGHVGSGVGDEFGIRCGDFHDSRQADAQRSVVRFSQFVRSPDYANFSLRRNRPGSKPRIGLGPAESAQDLGFLQRPQDLGDPGSRTGLRAATLDGL